MPAPQQLSLPGNAPPAPSFNGSSGNSPPLRLGKISVAQILGYGDEVRSQDPDIQSTGGKRPRYYIRPYVERIVNGEVVRVQERIYLRATTKRAAITEKNTVMATVNHSKYVIQSQMNFGEFLDYYIKEHVQKPENIGAGTRAKYESHIKNHIRPGFGHLPMALVDTKTIDSWLGEKARSGLSWSTRTDLRNLMCGIFTQARRWGYWKELNPAEDVTVGKQRAVRKPVKLTIEQTRDLLAALPRDVCIICEVALYCMLRISEVLGLQWQHIDLLSGKILVRQRWYRGDLDVVKSLRAERDVPLGKLADDLLARHPGAGHEDDFVFSVQTHVGDWKKTGACRDDRAISQHFLKPAAIKLGIYQKGFGFHAFRREAITEHGGVLGQMQTQRMAGHSKADMSQHYTLADFAAQERSVLAFQDRVRIKPDQAKPAGDPETQHPDKPFILKGFVVGPPRLELETSTVSR
jgi:integrase